MLRSALLNVMIKAARKAARSLMRDFGEVENLQVSLKGPANFVTAGRPQGRGDRCARSWPRRGRTTASSARRAAAVEGADPTHRWIVDPLDGTTNFLHGMPHFAISIALEREGEIVAGVIYDPANDEMFVAESGKGAFLNDRRLRVSARRSLADAVIALRAAASRPRRPRARRCARSRRCSRTVAGMRRFGSAALDLAYVAAGRLDGYWERNSSPGTLPPALIWCARPAASSPTSTARTRRRRRSTCSPATRRSTAKC